MVADLFDRSKIFCCSTWKGLAGSLQSFDVTLACEDGQRSATKVVLSLVGLLVGTDWLGLSYL